MHTRAVLLQARTRTRSHDSPFAPRQPRPHTCCFPAPRPRACARIHTLGRPPLHLGVKMNTFLTQRKPSMVQRATAGVGRAAGADDAAFAAGIERKKHQGDALKEWKRGKQKERARQKAATDKLLSEADANKIGQKKCASVCTAPFQPPALLSLCATAAPRACAPPRFARGCARGWCACPVRCAQKKPWPARGLRRAGARSTE